MRVYLPLTLPALAEAHQAGELAPGPLEAYAVTPGLRAWYASDDLEELEYAALGQAAHAALGRLAVDPGAARRRVVLALDLPDGAVTARSEDRPAGDAGPDAVTPGLVELAGPVPLAKAAAVHVDADGAASQVTAAVAALDAAERGDVAARSVVDEVEEHELLWFATQEIPQLLG